MSQEETINLGLPRVNFSDVTIGLGGVLYWGLGPSANPEDLTGRAVEVVLWPGQPKQQRLVPTRMSPSTGQIWLTAPILPDVVRYLLLVADIPNGALVARVAGEIEPGERVNP